MENIGDKVLRNLKFLAHIDLAHNQLSRTQPFDETFSKLFHNHVLLEEINVGYFFNESKTEENKVKSEQPSINHL